MKSIEEIYELFDQVGCCSFATLDAVNGVETRIAHLFAYDDEGLYLRTMTVKPFYRQLIDSKKLSVCGEYTSSRVKHDEDGLPLFQPGYQVRISGDVRLLSAEEVNRKAQNDKNFNVAVYDSNKYPETRVFVLYRARGEYYDYDYAKVNRDHKLYRERFAFGGMEFTEPGLLITDACIACGACQEACTFAAIQEGEPYWIRGERCDECGNCYHVCPVNAVIDRHGYLG